MINDIKLVPQFTYEQCKNCNGYGTKGFQKVPCPTCKTTGIIKIPLVRLTSIPEAKEVSQ